MTSSPFRRGFAAALLALGLLGLSACGSEDSTDAGPSTSTTASVPTDSGAEVDVQEFAALMAASFEDASTATVRMVLAGGPSDVTADGAIDYSATPPAMQLDLTLADPATGGQEMQMRMVDEVIYLRSPLTGDKFLAIDANSPNNPLGTTLTDQLDPRSMMGDLESSIESVSVVGEETIDGDQVTVYAVEMDAAAMTKQWGPDASAEDLPEELVYQMAFDDDGHFRRMSVDLGDQAGTMEMTFSDWGEDVTIEAPPDDQVTQMPGMS